MEHLLAHSEVEVLLPLIAERMKIIMEPHPLIEAHRKAARLQNDFATNAKSFASMVDLRPDITDERTAVTRLLPIYKLKIVTDLKARINRTIVVQLDDDALDELEFVVGDLRKKNSLLRDTPGVAGLIGPRSLVKDKNPK